MTRSEKIALVISLLAIFITAWISYNIFQGIPHLEDEFAYVWQAKAITQGKLTIPSPPEYKSFLVPFVVDYEGQRFGKYPIGWPIMLSLGERIRLPWLVNPFLAGLAVWLTFRLCSKLINENAGVLAAALTATSPFFLMNSGSLLSHSWGLVLSTVFAISWLDSIEKQRKVPEWIPPVVAGLTMGLLALTRPFTALGVAIPFGVHGIISLIHGAPNTRKRIIAIGIVALVIGSLHFVWQYAATGDPFLNPYTLWWEYDKIGFGPGIGVTEQGHTLRIAWDNLKITMNSAYSDLFGWFKISWLFIPFGLWSLRENRKSWVIISVAPALIVLYLGYWIGAWALGPRYYFESLYSLTILTSAGIFWLAGWKLKPGDDICRGYNLKQLRPTVVIIMVALLVGSNLAFYTPHRIGGMRGLYGTSRGQLEPFLKSGEGVVTPALVIVDTDEWRKYAGLLELASPTLDSPWIFIWNRGPKSTARVIEAFPDRQVYYYSPETPWVLYTKPQ
jgi:hypothetical protein